MSNERAHFLDSLNDACYENYHIRRYKYASKLRFFPENIGIKHVFSCILKHLASLKDVV